MDDDPMSSHALLPPSASLRKNTRGEDELVELLWQNGQVVMHSQTHREANGRPCQKPESAPRCAEPLDPLPDPARNEDASPWVQYPIDDPLMRDFYLDFFYGLPAAEPTEARIAVEPPSGQFLEKEGAELGWAQVGGEESSPLMGSNETEIHGSCSNSVKVPSAKGSDDSQTGLSYSEVQEAGVASPLGGSALSFRVDSQQSTDTGSYKKRKQKDVDGSQCQNEEAEDESAEATRPYRRSVLARRARVAHVHNLSERRRRDRINEKMRALQELIPHCNKTDKASMLDEAIEYLKSLQLQVQMMLMGGGMSPVMFSGLQHLAPPMGLVMSQNLMPTFTRPIQLPRVPLANRSMPPGSAMNHSAGFPLPPLNMANFPGQSQSYPAYLAFQHLQSSPQVMNLYGYGSKLVEASQMLSMAASNEGGGSAALPEFFPNVRTCEMPSLSPYL